MPVRSRASKAAAVPRSASADWMRSTSSSAASITSAWISGWRVQADAAMTVPINADTVPSLTASHSLSSLSSPMPPVSSVLTMPTSASPLILRRRQPSHSPKPTGKASASTSAGASPRRCGPLSCISTSAGATMVIAISSSGFGLAGIGGIGSGATPIVAAGRRRAGAYCRRQAFSRSSLAA